MKKLILVVFLIVLIVLVYLFKNYDQIKIWFLNRIILERGILAPSCPWYKISDLFLKDSAGINLYNEYKKKYGDFALSSMFNEEIYIVTNVNYIQQILDNSPDTFNVGDLKRKIFGSFMKKNVGVSSGCPWKRRREINERALLTDQLHVYSEKYNQYIHNYMEKIWKNKNEVDYDDFLKLGKYMVSKIVFNTSHIHKDVFQLLSEANTTNAFHPQFNIDAKVHQNYNDFLNIHLENPKINSLVSLCMDISSDKEEVKDQIPHFIFPIIGLYVTSIPRILVLLLNHKQKFNKVLNEINSIDKRYELFSEKIYQLNYLRKCILETLRLMNPLITTFRTLAKDYTFDDKYSFQKGTQFLILNNPVLREPEYYKQSNRFIPERWTEEMEQSYYAISFNQGPQRCPAKELVIFLAQSFIYNFIILNNVCKLKAKNINTQKIPQIINPCDIKINLN